MSKKSARRERAARQAPPPVGKGAAGIPRAWLYGGAAFVAVAVAVAVVLAIVLGGGGGDAGTPLAVDGTATQELLDGIAQDGIALGSPDAPVKLVEFADLQCPFCQKASTQVLPAILDEYVRSGDVQIVFRGVSFIGPDSEKALRAALAAAEQDKLWNVVDLLYLHQGGENEGWVTDDLLRAVGAAVPGLDVDAMMAARDSDAVDQALAAASNEASAAQVRGTPTFFVGKVGEALRQIQYSDLEPGVFREAIDAALGS
jgi:protein-disulfide isomerase